MEIKLNTIHKDSRGVVYTLTGGLKTYPEITIFTTNASFARGGCIHHKSGEFVCVLEGEIQYVYGEDAKTKTLKAGDTLYLPPSTPHYFVSIESSLVAEWGATAEEKAVKHPFFRALVDAINRGKQ